MAEAREAVEPEQDVTKAYRMAYSVARSMFHFPHIEAEDVAQEMALRTFNRTRDVDVNSSWIRTGAIFLCVDMLRARESERQALSRLRFEAPVAAGLPPRDVDLGRALDGLPLACRELLRLHFWDGLTWKEIDSRLAAGRRCSQYQARKCLDHLLAHLETGGRA